MKLFVIGATGRTGHEIVEQALARGHDVTAFVRLPESISQRNERLTIVRGNVMDENELRDAMQNHDAVVNFMKGRKLLIRVRCTTRKFYLHPPGPGRNVATWSQRTIIRLRPLVPRTV